LPTDCSLTAIIRQGRLLLPRPDLVLAVDDEVLAVIHAEQTAALAALLSDGQP
jgi:Trk K+ transport system NAD-binding subunit